MPAVQLPNPHGGQRAVLEAIIDPDIRFVWLAAGRRWYKTTLGVAVAVRWCLKNSWRVLWGAPTYDQCRIAWDEALRAASSIVDANRTRMEMTFPGGGCIIFRSLDDPNNARGHTADAAIIDEVGFVKEPAWYDVVRPMLGTTLGPALLMGTPNGMNWFFREFGQAPLYDDSIAFQSPTLGVEILNGKLARKKHPHENPGFSFSEAVRMYNSMPQQTFRQEFLAEFIEDSGGVFRGVTSVSVLEPQATAVPGHTYVMGVDWARHKDWTVISVFDSGEKEQVWLERLQDLDYFTQTTRLKSLIEIYDPFVVVCEENAMGGPLIEQLQDENYPVWPQNTNVQTKRELIDDLALNIERGLIKLLNNQTQISELLAYEMNRTPHGFIKFGAPEGMHDDCVMSLAMAVRAIEFAGPVMAVI